MASIVTWLKKYQSIFLPLLFSLIIFIPVLIWLNLDSKLPHYDMGRHLYNSLQYGRLILDYVAGRESLLDLLTTYYYYPPLLYCVSYFFFLFFGVNQDAAVISNLFWIYIAVYAIYNSASMLWNKKTAVIAVVLLFAMPMVIGQIREFQLDFPLTAWVALTYYQMLKLKGQFNTNNAVWLGIIIGLGMLLKWTYLAYTLTIVVVMFPELYSQLIKAKKPYLKYPAYILSIASVLCGVWYISNRHQIRIDFVANGVDAAIREADPVGVTLDSIKYYLTIITEYYLPTFLWLVFAVAVAVSVYSKQFLSKNRQLLFIIIGIYLIFTLLPNKDPRYILPITSFIAIFIASLFNLKSDKTWRMVCCGLALVILILNNAFAVFNLSNGKDISAGKLSLFKGRAYTTGAPSAQICPVEKIVSIIPIESSARVVGSNTMEFNNWMMAYYLEKAGRVWAGENNSEIDKAQYWIVRLDHTPESKQFLFEYQEKGRVLANVNCSDKTLVVILKNAKERIENRY